MQGLVANIASKSRSVAVRMLALGLLASVAILAAYQVRYTYEMDLGNPNDSFFASGFDKIQDDPEINFRWTTGSSVLVFPGVSQNQGYQLRMRMATGPRPGSLAPPLVSLYANGIEIREIQARPALRTYSVDIGPQVVARAPDLIVQIAAPTFVPSESIPGSSDTRNLGVVVDHFELEPTGISSGWLVLPPLPQLLGWVLATWLLFGLTVAVGSNLKAKQIWRVPAAGVASWAIALALAREWAAYAVWYLCAVLALGCIAARPFSAWVKELVSTRRIPFGFLHTIGIQNPRLRAAVEVVIISALAVNYFVTIVFPLGKQTLGDFSVYYAGASVWLQGGNLYDQSQLQQFNLSHRLLDSSIGPFTSPPSALLLFAPFALLPFAQAKAAWLTFGFILLIGSGFFLWLAARASVPRPPSPVWLALMFYASGSLQHTFDFGQVNTLYSFLFALGLWAWTKRRTAITGVAMVFGAAVKVFSAVFVPYFLLRRAWRALAASIAGGAILVFATAVLTGLPTWLNYTFIVLPDASAHRVSSFDQSLLVFLRRTNSLLGIVRDNDQLDKTPSVEMSIIAFVITALLLALTVSILGRFAERDALHEQLEFAAVIVVMMLILPRMWEHYLMWLILPFYLILAFLSNRSLTIAEQIAIVLALGASWVFSQDSPDLFTRPGWPTALISIGLYGTFLVYLCVLYLSTRVPFQEEGARPGVKLQGTQGQRPLKAKV